MNSFPVNIEDYFARVLNIKMCMRKIFYPILLLALIACKGQQQTADSESVADPATESVNPEMGKNNGQSDADATAQPEVDAITSATSRPNQVSFNGRIVLPPQRQATVALTIGGVIKNTSLLPGQTRYQELCNRHFGESGVYRPPTDLSGQPRTNRISAYGIRTAKESLCRTSGFAEEVPAKQSGLSFDEKPSGCCRRTTFAFGRESGNTASGWHPAASGSKSSYQRICGQCSYEHGKVHQSGRSSLRSDR